MILFAEQARGLAVVGCSPEALPFGIRAGMPLAEARGLAGRAESELVLEPATPEIDQSELCRLAGQCQRYSPLVGLEDQRPAEALFLEIAGCGPHFGGEQALASHLLDDLAVEQWDCRIAVADTPGAAWAVAHFGSTRIDPVRLVDSGQHRSHVRSLPIDGLRISPDIRQVLCKLDLRTIGQVEQLPRSTLPARFGPELQRRLDQLWGVTHEVISPVLSPAPLIARWILEEPVADRRAWEIIARELLQQVLSDLTPRRQGIREFRCELKGTVDSLTVRVRLVTAAQDERHLWDLLLLEWDRVERTAQRQQPVPRCLIDGVVEVLLEVTDAVPLRVRQQTLFEMEPGQREQQAFRQMIERLASRLGEDCVLQVQTVAEAQPELACDIRTWSNTPVAAEPSDAWSVNDWGAVLARSRPLRLLPEPSVIQVLALAPDGPPHTVWWNQRRQRLSQVWGPERIATGWWREKDVQRDYYRVETSEGIQLWIFHCYHTQNWFLHGLYD